MGLSVAARTGAGSDTQKLVMGALLDLSHFTLTETTLYYANFWRQEASPYKQSRNRAGSFTAWQVVPLRKYGPGSTFWNSMRLR